MAQSTLEAQGPSYPGEVPLHKAHFDTRSEWLRPHLGWAIVGAVAGWFFGLWIGNIIAGNSDVTQNTSFNNIALVLAMAFGVVGWLIGIGALTYPLLKMVGREPAPELPSQSWARYFRMTDDHKVVGLQYAIGVLTFLFTGGLLAMAHPYRAAQPDEPRLRPGNLHRVGRRARHHHDDDGLFPGRRTARQLSDPAHDRLSSHGLPTGRGVLVLDFHGRVPRHPDRTAARRVPDGLDGLRAAADSGVPRYGRVPCRLCRHRRGHDRGRVQPGGDDHQLPGSGDDLEQGPDLRLVHTGHLRALDAGYPDPRRRRATSGFWTARRRQPSM